MANTTINPGRSGRDPLPEGAMGDQASTAASVAGSAASTAKDHAAEMLSATGEQAREVAAQAKEQMSTALSGATDQARKALRTTTAQAKGQADERARQAARSMRQASSRFQALAEGRVDEAGPVGDYARQAADRLSTLARRVDEDGIQGLLREVSRFARRRPGLFIMGAVAAGFAAGRIAKHQGGAEDSQVRLPEPEVVIPAVPVHTGDASGLPGQFEMGPGLGAGMVGR